MKKEFIILIVLFFNNLVFSQKKSIALLASIQVKVENGMLSGEKSKLGVCIFKGIPYAQAPVGKLRWKPPQAAKNWSGVRDGSSFGNRSMQMNVFGDIVFRSKEESEDCLYLNIWVAPLKSKEKLPVLVYFHGGGLFCGDGSEPRYDGENMASKGIIVITVNYRLGIFGFFAHPQLTKESPHHASGNYGLLDQQAAIKWVHKNIAAFGGDPSKITIGGQSAGSRSVSAHMASPLSKGLFTGAIGESGSILAISPPKTLTNAEKMGIAFAQNINATTIEKLRKIPAKQLRDLAAKSGMYFGDIVDGYFLPESPIQIYASGRQMDVPLLAGWTSAEVGWQSFMNSSPLDKINFEKIVKDIYGEKWQDVIKLYPDSTQTLLEQSATDLSSDRFAGYSTWKWLDLHGKTNGHYVYNYIFSKLIPSQNDKNESNTKQVLGAPHSAEIPYVFGNLSLIKTYNWKEDDYKVSQMMQQYFVNFVKTGDPNGNDLPKWPGLQASIPKVMVFDSETMPQPEKNLKRYQFLDQFYYK